MPEMNVLEVAEQLTSKDRREQWGDPKKSLKLIAQIWSSVLDIQVEPEQVALCMIGLKLARAGINPHEMDSWVDIAGYARIGWEALK